MNSLHTNVYPIEKSTEYEKSNQKWKVYPKKVYPYERSTENKNENSTWKRSLCKLKKKIPHKYDKILWKINCLLKSCNHNFGTNGTP